MWWRHRTRPDADSEIRRSSTMAGPEKGDHCNLRASVPADSFPRTLLSAAHKIVRQQQIHKQPPQQQQAGAAAATTITTRSAISAKAPRALRMAPSPVLCLSASLPSRGTPKLHWARKGLVAHDGPIPVLLGLAG